MRSNPRATIALVSTLLLGLPASLVAGEGSQTKPKNESSARSSPASSRGSASPSRSAPSTRGGDSGTRVAPGTRNVRPPYHRPPHYRPGYPYHPHYYPWYGSRYWYGYWGFPYFWGSWGATTTVETRSYGPERGALDLDISPEEARVIVDGQLLGTCDDFDGYPGYLWLPEGRHEISFVLEGHETRTVEMEVVPGLIQRLDFTLEKGESILPPLAPPPGEAEIEVVEGEPARLHLEILPGDASVYLDGRFLGTADELTRLHSGLVVSPGRHVLQVVRPGYGPEERAIVAEEGEQIELDLRLQEG